MNTKMNTILKCTGLHNFIEKNKPIYNTIVMGFFK